MSVSAFILNPINLDERTFSIPVATEKYFVRIWEKAIRQLGIKTIYNGTVVTADILQLLLTELTMLKKWAMEELEGQEQSYMTTRINDLTDLLPPAFERKDCVVCIG